MLVDGRSWSSGDYRYGFNGKEKDIVGLGAGGATYDYGFRIYNPQIGKFLSVDPLTKSFPWYTPYQFAGNKPILCIDLDGAEELEYWKKIDYEGNGWDYLRAGYNGLVNMGNTIPWAWNQVVYVSQDISEGTVVENAKKDLKESANTAKKVINYIRTTPLLELNNQASNFIKSPQAIEIAVEMIVGVKFVPKRLPTLKVQKATTVVKTTTETKVMYRAVSKAELDEIKEFGGFIPKMKYNSKGEFIGWDGYQGKLFTETFDEALEHAKDLNNPYIIEVEVPTEFYDKLYKFTADNKSAISVDFEYLNELNDVYEMKKTVSP